MKLVDLVKKGNVAKLKYYQNKIFYYVIETPEGKKFQFEIPAEDTEGGKILPKDKASIFLRWIRKAFEKGEIIELIEQKEKNINLNFLQKIRKLFSLNGFLKFFRNLKP